MTKLRTIIGRIAICAIVGISARSSHAATIVVRLNLSSASPAIQLDGSGFLATADDGNAVTTGDHNTAIEFTGFLEAAHADINTSTASLSLSGLSMSAPTTVIGTLVIQNFSGGTMALYDESPANTLLLQGSLGVSALTGTLSGNVNAGEGGLFTTTFSNVTGGSLAQNISSSSLVLSMTLGGAVTGGVPGFTVSPTTGKLLPFQGVAAVTIKANPPIPEPASAVLLLAGGAVVVARRRRRR